MCVTAKSDARLPFRVNQVGLSVRWQCPLDPDSHIDIAPLLISVQTDPVEYRGIRYSVRVRIEREQWSVAIYPKGVEMAGKVVTGPQEKAGMLAHYTINKWLEEHPRKNY